MNEQDTARLARKLAHRIAQQLDAPDDARRTDDTSNDTSNNELARLRAHVAELNQRLAKIESRDTTSQTRPSSNSSPALPARSDAPTYDHDPAQIGTGGTYVSAVHPSGQRFGIGEAVSELVDYFEQSTKTCELEPGNKPCDHCAMCSSRGF